MTGRPSLYLTTPIFYVNDAPHIGHAYTSLACDVLARFMRLDGFRVKFLTGTDEHGQKVEKAARAAGMEPLAFCDKVSENFRALGQLLNLSNDAFIRTTEPRHARASHAIWKAMAASRSPKGKAGPPDARALTPRRPDRRAIASIRVNRTRHRLALAACS